VAGCVDRDHLLESEIPLQFRDHERSHKSARRSIDMNHSINILLDQQIINRLSILILSRISRAQNNANTNSILIHEVDSLLGINHVSVRCAINVLLLNLKISRRLLPANLDSRAHDDIWLVPWLLGSLASILPALLHREDSQHNSLRGSDGGCSNRSGTLVVNRGVEESANHGHASILDVSGLRVFFVVDEVLGEGFGHQGFDFFFLFVRATLDTIAATVLVSRRESYHVGGNEACQAGNHITLATTFHFRAQYLMIRRIEKLGETWSLLT